MNEGKTLKYKIRKFFGFFNMNNLKKEVAGLGYSLSTKNIILVTLAFVMAAFIAGYLLQLKTIYLMFLVTVFACCAPSLVIMKFRHNYEVTRFNAITEYMEQMIYSFHKNGKIRDSLQDVYDVSRGTIKEIVGEMIDCVDHDMTTSKIFEKAFSIMQSRFDCSRLNTLHEYLLEVEYSGGKSTSSLNMLLEDIRSWAERTLIYQSERKNVQNKVLISTFFAMLSCGLMINMIPAEFTSKIVVNPIYQIGTTVILLCCILTYVLASSKVCVSYLDNEVDNKKADYIQRCAEFVVKYRNKNHKKPMLIKGIICMGMAIVAWLLGYRWAVLLIAVASIFIIFNDVLHNNNCIKAIVREITKMFPVWIRNIVLYLQTDNVHVSIQKSYHTCPDVLKPEVAQLINDIQVDPSSTKPYSKFLSSYDVPNLKIAVNYLYSIAQFGSDDMIEQLDYLIQQNARLTINEEKMRNEDSLAGFSMFMFIPMLLAVFKLMLDLILFIMVFLGVMASYS